MALPGRVGRYAVLGELGQGAMGTVYRAHDETLDREVAVKVMSRGLADADSRARFLREARAAAKLQHPNIVVIYELGEHEGAPFMALELLDGVDLQRGIEAGVRPDPRATLPVVLQILAGLGHAHEHGIVHRDVKPSNVFLPAGRPAKIMDFGVARLSGLGTTTSGAVVGTPNYMSPEQVSAGEIDGRSDLFSAALILYELVTGERAFQADSMVAIMYRILHEAPDLSLIPAGAQWSRLRGVLARALARAPDDRYPDARTMSAELALALQDLGGAVDLTAPADQALLVRPRTALRPLAPPQAPAPPAAGRGASRGEAPRRRAAASPVGPRRSRLVAALGAAAALALAGATAWLALRPATAPTPGPTPAAVPSTAVPPEPTPAPEATATPSARPIPAVSPTPSGTPAAPTPAPTATPIATPAVPTPAPGLDPGARLERARDLLQRKLYAPALAEARAVLDQAPTSAEASRIAQQAEAELVIEECLRSARKALDQGDRERALEEVRRGFLVRKNDPRLLALFREAAQQ